MRSETDGILDHIETTHPLAEADIDVRRLPAEAPIEAPLGAQARRRFFRPTKQSVTIRLDTDIVAWFKAGAVDGGYQTAINRALREYMQQRS